MSQQKRLLIMAAGTGGHIFPGLALAELMQSRGWKMSWLGTSHGMERELVPRYGIEMDVINFSGLRGKGGRHALRGILDLLLSFVSCRRFLRLRKPDVVLGMGGYATVPGGVMAWLRGVPLVLVNADVSLLLSNKVLAPFATRVLHGFPSDLGPGKDKSVVTGNPVRKEIAGLPLPSIRYGERSGPLRLLVVGGSLGAKVLNECLPAALALLAPQARPQVTHQSGKQHIAALREAYSKAGVTAELIDFIDDISLCYADADLVICRAGAITVSELTAAGVASILVPLLASTTSHQGDNASWMASRNAAIYLPPSQLTAPELARILQSITRQDCLAMAQAAYENGRREACETIADILQRLAGPENRYEA